MCFQRQFLSLLFVFIPLFESFAQLTASVHVKHITCNGAANACATVFTSGGAPPFQIEWSVGGVGVNSCGYDAGEFGVTVMDADSTETFVV